jgi:hypothetical protein
MYARGESLNHGGSHAMEYAAIESPRIEAAAAAAAVARAACMLRSGAAGVIGELAGVGFLPGQLRLSVC